MKIICFKEYFDFLGPRQQNILMTHMLEINFAVFFPIGGWSADPAQSSMNSSRWWMTCRQNLTSESGREVRIFRAGEHQCNGSPAAIFWILKSKSILLIFNILHYLYREYIFRLIKVFIIVTFMSWKWVSINICVIET